MKISEMIKRLEKIKKEYGDMDLVYSSDPEGNHYDEVYFGPTVGCWIAEEEEWVSKDHFIEDSEYFDRDLEINSVCVN